MTASDRKIGPNRRLDTWKEIGAFFGRDERTVKRWEVTRGLPVHRVPGGGRANVYVNTDELIEWLKGKNDAVESGQNAQEPAGPAISPAPTDQPNDGLTADSASFGRRIQERRNEDSSRDVSRLWHRLRYVAAAVVVLGSLAILGEVHRSSSARSARTTTETPSTHHAIDPEAQQLYLKGVFYFDKRTPETLNQAVDYFTQAVVRDPQYAEAYVGLADCYNLLREYSLMPASEAYPRAMNAAKRAMALDDSLSGAHSSLAFVDFYWSWDVAGAQHEFERSLALDPKSVLAHHWYATFLLHLARYQEALSEIEKAQQLEPMSSSILADKGLILFYAGQKEQALALLKQLEATEPGFLSPHNYLAYIYLAQANYAQYLAESRKSATLLHDEHRLAVLAAGEKGLARSGSSGMFTAMLKAQQGLDATGQESAYGLARMFALLGNKQDALSNLQVSYSKREPEILALKIDPALSSLRAEPGYRELLARIGLPAQP
jgi:tetratricopeptide (TPR) repeat protein